MITALVIAAGLLAADVALALLIGKAIRVADERSACCPNLEAGEW